MSLPARAPTLAECEARIERHMNRLVAGVSEPLLLIHDHRLYRDTHRSFEAYLLGRWGISRATGYRWLTTARETRELRESDAETAKPQVNASRDETLPPAAGPITSGQGRKIPTPEIAGSGTVPDQDPGGVTLAEVALRSPQEPSPSPQSPPVADVLGTGSPPPERTTPPADPGRVGVRGFDAPAGGEPRPASSSGAAIRAALDLLAKTSVEELRAAGHARLRDAADRLAEADGRKLVTLHEWAETRAELRRHREAPTVPSKAPRAGKATAVASGGRSGGKTPTTPPTSNPTGVCTHPPARWNRLAYGVFCGVEGCGAKVR